MIGPNDLPRTTPELVRCLTYAAAIWILLELDCPRAADRTARLADKLEKRLAPKRQEQERPVPWRRTVW
jgi:hypothetical protein